MQLNLFNGGLSVRLASHLIQQTESLICTNVESQYGDLRPKLGNTNLNIDVNKSIYNFKNSWISSVEDRSYVEFQEKLYYSNGVSVPKKSSDGVTWYNLGIVKPSVTPTVSQVTTSTQVYGAPIELNTSLVTATANISGGNLLSNTYSYIVVISNSSIGYRTTKYVSIYTSSDTSSVTFNLSAYVGATDTLTIYRLYKDTYRLVASTTGLSIVDNVYDIGTNTEITSYSTFSNPVTYQVLLTETSTNKQFVKDYTVQFDNAKDTYGVKFEPIIGFTFKVYRNSYEVNLVANGGYHYDIGDISDTKLLDVPMGIYQYCYTYYNSSDGSESQPSDYSQEIDVKGNEIHVIVTASTDAQVDKIRLYRLGGNNISMSLVTELSNASITYVDKAGDTTISGEVLDSFNNKQAPVGLKYLTEANAMFFGSIGDKLYYSDVAYVNAWSEFYFIDFDDSITGIGSVQNGLLVFTRFKTYIITGNSPSTLSKYLLSGSQGCVAHSSIQYAKNTLLWVSTDGICMSTGGDIEVISKKNLGKLSLQPTCSVLYDEIYYVAHSTGTLIVDLRFGLTFSNLDIKPISLHIYNDTLYCSLNSKLYSIGTEDSYLTLHYKSPLFSDGSNSMVKNYKNLYVSSTGNLTFKVYIDEQLVMTKQLEAGIEDIKLPQQSRLGYTIQFEVIGTGIVKEIEYKVDGRQNGR